MSRCFTRAVLALLIVCLPGRSAGVRFSFVDSHGDVGTFVIDPSVASHQQYPGMVFYSTAAMPEFRYLDFKLTGFHVSVYSGRSLFGLVHTTIPGGDLNISFEGTAIYDALPGDSAAYRFVGGGIFTDKYGDRTIVAFKPGYIVDSSSYIDCTPQVQTGPVDITATEGELVGFSLIVRGCDLQYRWYQNGRLLEGQTGPVLMLGRVEKTFDGYRYYCIIENVSGRDTSRTATLTVTSFDGIEAAKVTTKPVVDGQREQVWQEQGKPRTLTETTAGTAPSDSDLNATAEVLWDDQNLYVLTTVTDDSSSGATDSGDAVTVKVENKTKPADRPEALELRVPRGKSGLARSAASVATGSSALLVSGYRVECVIPWSAVGTLAREGDYISITVEVHDDDGRGVETVLATPDQRVDGALQVAGDCYHLARLVTGVTREGRDVLPQPHPQGWQNKMPAAGSLDLLGRRCAVQGRGGIQSPLVARVRW